MDLNILLTPLYGNGAKIETFHPGSLELGDVNYNEVLLDETRQERVNKTQLVTGLHRRKLVLECEELIPLHLGHALDLLVNPQKMGRFWQDRSYITFDGCTIRRGDGVLIVPCLYKAGYVGAPWFLGADELEERAVPAASALIYAPK